MNRTFTNLFGLKFVYVHLFNKRRNLNTFCHSLRFLYLNLIMFVRLCLLFNKRTNMDTHFVNSFMFVYLYLFISFMLVFVFISG
ncbi:hypothetical protein HanIR_Chr08g0345041 [Helianthus annuus]|nr:hypothetical protein HanIR_Chr08g0345041 [Helianthus annuus]